MRVIAGSAKGHKLKTIKGMSTRPTTDRVKETLFNILSPYIVDAEVFDPFSGSGGLAIEALSRGASFALMSDLNRECVNLIQENLVHTKLLDKAQVLQLDHTAATGRAAFEKRKFDIIFLDPPYNKNFIQEMLKIMTINDIIRENGIVAAEHHKDDALPVCEGGLELAQTRKYGDTCISFYVKRK